VSPVTK